MAGEENPAGRVQTIFPELLERLTKPAPTATAFRIEIQGAGPTGPEQPTEDKTKRGGNREQLRALEAESLNHCLPSLWLLSP